MLIVNFTAKLIIFVRLKRQTGELTFKIHLVISMQLKKTNFHSFISSYFSRRVSLFTLITLLAFLLLSAALKAQQPIFRHEEDSLRILSNLVYSSKVDSIKLDANSRFSGYLSEVLQKPGVFNWPFDSLSDIGCLKAPDNAFRIFNWNLPLNNGTFSYFGFILIPGKRGDSNRVIPLRDRSDSITNAIKQVLPVSQWYGALYYSILKQTWKKQQYYTLLAWDGYSPKSSRKIIDILTFDKSGQPQFGWPMFMTAEGTQTRVIIEYSRRATFLLRYDNQYLVTAQRRDGRPVTKKMGMIVFDRLVPVDPRFKGQFEYYVPSGETYDAFIFNRGFWQMAEDVLVSNPSEKKKAKEVKPVEYNLFPPK